MDAIDDLLRGRRTRRACAAGISILLAPLSVYMFVVHPVEVAGPAIPLLLGSVLILIVPGLLALKLVGVRLRSWLCQLGIGAAVSIVLLYTVSCILTVFWKMGLLEMPLSRTPVLVSGVGLVALLSIAVAVRVRTTGWVPRRPGLQGKWSDGLGISIALLSWGILGPLVLEKTGAHWAMVMFVIIALTTIVHGIARDRSERYYHIVLFSLACSLSLHWTLPTGYLVGWDVHAEYYFTKLTAAANAWEPSHFQNLNAILSTTTLPVFWARFIGIPDHRLLWFAKVIVPSLFAFVGPLLFSAFHRGGYGRRATFAGLVVLLMSAYFYQAAGTMPRLAIAELFIVAVLYLNSQERVPRSARAGLTGLMIWGVIASHYATAAMFLLLAVAASLAYSFLWRWDGKAGSLGRPLDRPPLASPSVVLFFGVAFFAWFAFQIGGATVLDSLLRAAERGVILASGGEVPGVLETQDQLISRAQRVGGLTVMGQASRVVTALVLLCIGAGAAVEIVSAGKPPGPRLLRAYALAGCLLVLMGLVVPFFARSVDFGRILHQALLFLSPFLVPGAVFLGSRLASMLRQAQKRVDVSAVMPWLVGLLLFFGGFQTGLLYEVPWEEPAAYTLSPRPEYPAYAHAEYAAVSWAALSGPARGDWPETAERDVDVLGPHKSALLLNEFVRGKPSYMYSAAEGGPDEGTLYLLPPLTTEEGLMYLGRSAGGDNYLPTGNSALYLDLSRLGDWVYDNGGHETVLR